MYYLVVNEQVSQSLDSDRVYAALEIGQGAQLFRIYSSTSEPVQCLTRMLPGHLLSEVFGVRSRTRWEAYIFLLAWEYLCGIIPWNSLEKQRWIMDLLKVYLFKGVISMIDSVWSVILQLPNTR